MAVRDMDSVYSRCTVALNGEVYILLHLHLLVTAQKTDVAFATTVHWISALLLTLSNLCYSPCCMYYHISYHLLHSALPFPDLALSVSSYQPPLLDDFSQNNIRD